MQLAIRIVRACMKRVEAVAKRAVQGTDGALRDAVIEFVRNEVAAKRGIGEGGKFVKRSAITAGVWQFAHIKERDKDDLFNGMVKDELLVEDRIQPPRGGRPAQAFAVCKRG